MGITAALQNRIKAVKENFGALLESGLSVNQVLLLMYQEETGETDFRIFKEWLKNGYKVKKGEKGFPVFSRSLKKIKEENDQEAGNRDNGRYFTAYLFHAGQVEPVVQNRP